MEAYSAAHRAKCEEIERELEREAAASVGDAGAVTIKQYATEHWLRMHPRGGHAQGRDLARMVAIQLGHPDGDPSLVYRTTAIPIRTWR